MRRADLAESDALRLNLCYLSEAGKILQRALHLKSKLEAGIRVHTDELDAAELTALLVIEEEITAYEKEMRGRNS